MAPKRNRLGLNDLSDSLLIVILSKIPLKQAVCCSVVSKRWKFLWTFLPNLKFSLWDFDFSSSSCSRIVDGIFERHSGPLELFEFINFRSFCTNDKICEWIHRAALKDVREIRIEGSTSRNFSRFEVPTSIFLCNRLRSLALERFLLTNIPHCFGGFSSLATLNLYNVELNDKTIELMLQLCPVLEILIIRDCHGLKRLKICSDSLISLNLSDSRIEAVTANCPRLVSLILIKMLGSTVEMEFSLPTCLSLCTDCAQLEKFTTLKSLRKITFLNLISKHDVMILSEFPDLEQMCIDSAGYSALDFSRGWYDKIPEISATFSLENLKLVHLNMTLFYDLTPLLEYLFRRAPAMKVLLVSRKKGFDGIIARRFVNRLVNLERPSPKMKILISGNTSKEVRCLNCDLEKFSCERETIWR